MENKKIGFFSRIKIAVAKLENYNLFVEEKPSIAVKYFFLIVLVLALVISGIQTFDVMQKIQKGYQYVKNEMADFSYENGTLSFSEKQYGYDSEYDFYLIADTDNEITDEMLQEYKTQVKSSGLIFLRNKVIYKSGNSEVEYQWADLSKQYGITSLDKTQLVEEIESVGMMGIAITMLIAICLSMYIIELVSTFIDWLMITIFSLIVARVCRIHMRWKHGFNISIYALTLPIILSMLYNIANYMTGFYTQYFRVVYLLISYVYVVAVILMIKSDLLKQEVEVGRIIETQKEIHEELQNPEDKEDKKEKKKPEEENPSQSDEKPTNEEPDGSEI